MLLPDPTRAWYAILDASGIGDHDSSRADQRWLAWDRGGRKAPRPPAWAGGEMDPFRAILDGWRVEQRPSCALEAFHSALEARVQARLPERAERVRGLSPAERARQARDRRQARTEAAPTWEDVEALLPVLRELPGLETARLPDAIADELAEQAARAWDADRAAEALCARALSLPIRSPRRSVAWIAAMMLASRGRARGTRYIAGDTGRKAA